MTKQTFSLLDSPILLTTHHSPLTTRHSPLTTRHSPLIMKSEDWGIAIGVIVAIGSVIGPWMWSVNSKLARIASYTLSLRHMAKVLLSHAGRLDAHSQRLDTHASQLEALERRLSRGRDSGVRGQGKNLEPRS
jgi:hypothetical protein